MPASRTPFALLSLAALLTVFGVSLGVGPTYLVAILYVPVVLLGLTAPRPVATYWLAAGATVLLAVTDILIGQEPTTAEFAHSASIAAGLWGVAWIIVRRRRIIDQRRVDLSARHEAEEALRRSHRELEDFKYALDQSAIVAMTNVGGDITYVNDKFCAISKYTREELLGRNHRILNSGYHPTEFFRAMYAMIANGRVWRAEICNRAKDGSLYWVDTTIVPFLDDRGRPYQYVAIRYDVTERKQSEAALRDQASLTQLGKMAAVVAHEVRNPLAGMRGALQVIARRLPPAGQEHAIIHEVVGRLDALNEIVQDLLLFARPAQPVMASVPVSIAIAETMSLVEQDPSATGVQVHVAPTDAVVRADPSQLKLVLLNLLMNGVQAMKGRGEITVTTEVTGAFYDIHIADRGPGIPPQVREHLFEPFFTTRHRGTGLGLVTARRLIEAHGGTVRLDDRPGGGTVAVVRLPAST